VITYLDKLHSSIVAHYPNRSVSKFIGMTSFMYR